MSTLPDHVLGAFLASLGALVSEALRRKSALDKLAADMQARVLRGQDPLAHRRLVYPKGYAASVVAYAAAASVMSLAVAGESNFLIFLYIGLALPSFSAAVIAVAEPVLPGAIDQSRKTPPPLDPSPINVDDTTVTSSTVPIKRIKNGRYRRANGLYRYLAS